MEINLGSGWGWAFGGAELMSEANYLILKTM